MTDHLVDANKMVPDHVPDAGKKVRRLVRGLFYAMIRPDCLCRRCGELCVFNGGVCWPCAKVRQ